MIKKAIKAGIFLFLTGPLIPATSAAYTTVSTANAYMVENTTGTDPSGNACYEFQTRPTCAATIANLTTIISSGSIGPGSTNYIQNTATPTTATQIFNVSSGAISGLATLHQTNVLSGNSLSLYNPDNSSFAFFTNTGATGRSDTIWSVGTSSITITASTTTIPNAIGTTLAYSSGTIAQLATNKFSLGGNPRADTQGMFNADPTKNYIVAYSTNPSNAGPFAIDISTQGHLSSQNNPGVSVASCGTGSPSVTGSDHRGAITIGGGAPTACTLNFAIKWVLTPTCLAISNGNAAAAVGITSISNSSVVFNFGAGAFSIIHYICIGSD